MNFNPVFGTSAGGAQALWSWDSVKWSGGLNNKEYFAHAGELTLSDTTVVADAPVPVTSSMGVSQAETDAMVLDGKNTAGEAWDLVEWSTEEYKIGSAEIPADSGMKFKTLWTKNDDGAALWFLIDMKDPTLDATSRAWNQDNVRVYIDEDGVNEDSAKAGINKDDYGNLYVSSEFMSYAPNDKTSKGFEYKVEKKADNSGYVVEVKYTFQNAALAVAGTNVRANISSVYANAENANSPVQTVWSWDSVKWSNGTGLNDKDCFAHAGTLTLIDSLVTVWKAPTLNAKQTTVDSIKIDGKVTEDDIWEQVEWSDPAVCYKANPIVMPNDPTYDATYSGYGFKFKTLWAKESDTKAYVFFLVDVNDVHLTSTKRAWASDNIRIFIDETGNAPAETLAKRDREAAYISSEFMSYATTENVTGFKYRCAKKADGSGYILEVRYTLIDPTLAAAGSTMKLNVVGNDADSTNDDGSHFAQQFSWGHNTTTWGTLNQIDYIENAGTLTLVEDLVKLEEQATTPPVTTEETPVTTTEAPVATTEAPVTTEETPAATTEAPAAEEAEGCRSGIGFAVLPVLAILGFAFTSRKKED